MDYLLGLWEIRAMMNITKNKRLIILFGLCMILFTSCGNMGDPEQNEGFGRETDLQQNEELSEWEKLYDQWQGKELETKLSFGREIYSVSVVRRCGNDDESIMNKSMAEKPFDEINILQ